MWFQRKVENEAALAPRAILVLQETKAHTLAMLQFYEKSPNRSHHMNVKPRG